MANKELDQVPARSFQSFRTAEIRGVRLNKSRIEVVLADQEAESVPQPGMTVVRAILWLRLRSLLVVPGGTW